MLAIQNRPLSRKWVTWLCVAGDAFAESIGKDGSDQCGDAECEEVNPAGSAPLNLVGIDFLDDGVRNHRRAGGDSKNQAAYYSGLVSWY